MKQTPIPAALITGAHTPGPFVLRALDSTHKDYIEHRFLTTADFDEETSTGEIIAVLRGHGPKMEANATLLKAAPDLMAACEAAADILSQSHVQDNRHRMGVLGAQDIGSAIAILKSALARAEGRTP